MNATRWVSLTEFIKHLGRSGIVRVDETEKGLFIAWIDNSPKALARAEAYKKKERAVTSDEQRERMLIAEQIERANAATGDESSSSESPEPAGLQREEGAAPLRLTFGTNKSAEPAVEEDIALAPTNSTGSKAVETDLPPAAATSTSTVSTPQPAMKINIFKTSTSTVPTKAVPLKTNVFKALKAKSSSSSSPPVSNSAAAGDKRSRDEMPAAQRLILEEQERKRRRINAV